MTERGELRNPAHAHQDRNFAHIRFGNCTMTDIDGFLELRNRLFIFVESKFQGAPLPRGQCLALERLVDALHDPLRGRFAVAIVVDQWEEVDELDYAQLPVRCSRWCLRWTKQNPPMTLRDKVSRIEQLSRTWRPHSLPGSNQR